MKTLLIILFLSYFAYGAETEEQRKYNFSEMTPQLEKLFSAGDTLDPFSTLMHDTFEYADIYLDTPDWEIFKNGLSLRLRRRLYTEDGKRKTEYAFQLKSEMKTAGSIRMEVESDQLEIYRAEGKPLTHWLDLLFDYQTPIYSTPELTEASRIVQDWCLRKAGAPLAPFQELRFHFKRDLRLRPVLVGRSIRARSHIYTGEKIWVMEGSLDRARFAPALSPVAGAPAEHSIVELEVENKYTPPTEGTKFMNRFESLLVGKFGVKPGLDSKYRQSAKTLYGLRD